jgi:tRNA G18 (ribose-2'-O)-methylase SpoU
VTGAAGRVVAIGDPDDARIAAYRSVRERDLAGREGLFVAEGVVVLEKLLRSPRFRPQSVLVAAKRVQALAPLLAQVPAEAAIYAADQAVMDAVTGFHIHRGVLAIGRRGAPLDPCALLRALPARAVVAVLIGLSNHDNVGGVFRNAAAFGAGAVLLDAACCDPLYRKAIRVSVGAALTVPFARLAPGADVLELLDACGFEAAALSPGGAVALADWRASSRVALLLGAEGPGLPPDLLARTPTVRIAMAQGFDSLNVAVASGVVLHHLARAP